MRASASRPWSRWPAVPPSLLPASAASPPLVRDWDTGCLVTGHCPDTFAQRLEAILGHPDLRETMGQAARRYARELTWGAVARELLGLYRELLDSRCAATAHA